MELLRRVRLRIGEAILSNKVAKHKSKVLYSDFSQVKNIGVVWDASKPEEFAALTRFYQRMNEMKIEVRIIAYFDGKSLPDQFTAIRYLTFIRKNEISFVYHPTSAETNEFIKNPFDILIDINFGKQLPLRYITSLSTARLKVGLADHEKHDTPFSLMMELKNPVNIEVYLTEIIRYLEMIRN